MARQIVTQQAVTESAETLVAEGVEPSIVTVQARIGGGSYSTVKKFLDIWKEAKAQADASAPQTPAQVQAKGQEFARALWVLASRQAQSEVQQAKDAAQAEIAIVRKELADATNEIARLESVEAAHVATIDQQGARLREVELALAEAQTQARRVAELEKSLADLRAELDASRKEATDKAVEAGRLAGEADALRSQVHELLQPFKPHSPK